MTILSCLVTLVLCAGVAGAVVVESPASAPPPTSSTSTAPAPLPPRSAPDSGFSAGGPLSSTTTTEPRSSAPDVSAYRGLGAWVNAFDYVPAYHRPREGPLLLPDDLDAMAAVD